MLSFSERITTALKKTKPPPHPLYTLRLRPSMHSLINDCTFTINFDWNCIHLYMFATLALSTWLDTTFTKCLYCPTVCSLSNQQFCWLSTFESQAKELTPQYLDHGPVKYLTMDQPSDEKIASKSDGLQHKAEETHWQCECAGNFKGQAKDAVGMVIVRMAIHHKIIIYPAQTAIASSSVNQSTPGQS